MLPADEVKGQHRGRDLFQGDPSVWGRHERSPPRLSRPTPAKRVRGPPSAPGTGWVLDDNGRWGYGVKAWDTESSADREIWGLRSAGKRRRVKVWGAGRSWGLGEG